jgi:hypothetical protein
MLPIQMDSPSRVGRDRDPMLFHPDGAPASSCPAASPRPPMGGPRPPGPRRRRSSFNITEVEGAKHLAVVTARAQVRDEFVQHEACYRAHIHGYALYLSLQVGEGSSGEQWTQPAQWSSSQHAAHLREHGARVLLLGQQRGGSEALRAEAGALHDDGPSGGGGFVQRTQDTCPNLQPSRRRIPVQVRLTLERLAASSPARDPFLLCLQLGGGRARGG